MHNSLHGDALWSSHHVNNNLQREKDATILEASAGNSMPLGVAIYPKQEPLVLRVHGCCQSIQMQHFCSNADSDFPIVVPSQLSKNIQFYSHQSTTPSPAEAANCGALAQDIPIPAALQCVGSAYNIQDLSFEVNFLSYYVIIIIPRNRARCNVTAKKYSKIVRVHSGIELHNVISSVNGIITAVSKDITNICDKYNYCF